MTRYYVVTPTGLATLRVPFPELASRQNCSKRTPGRFAPFGVVVSKSLREQALDASGYNKRPEINLGAFFSILSFALVTPAGFKPATF